MEENCTKVDYYKALQCDRNATIDDIKKSYQRLALTMHPDKMKGDESEKNFLLIQEAWSILRNPDSRKQYDAELSCHEHSELLLYDTVSLSDMVHTNSSVYTYSCRCGGTYLLDTHECNPSEVVLGCDACSLSILVNNK